MMVVMMMSQTDSRGYSFFREYINVVRCGKCTHEFQNQRFGTSRNNTQYGRLLLYNDPPLTVACVFFTTNQHSEPVASDTTPCTTCRVGAINTSIYGGCRRSRCFSLLAAGCFLCRLESYSSSYRYSNRPPDGQVPDATALGWGVYRYDVRRWSSVCSVCDGQGRVLALRTP